MQFSWGDPSSWLQIPSSKPTASAQQPPASPRAAEGGAPAASRRKHSQHSGTGGYSAYSNQSEQSTGEALDRGAGDAGNQRSNAASPRPSKGEPSEGRSFVSAGEKSLKDAASGGTSGGEGRSGGVGADKAQGERRRRRRTTTASNPQSNPASACLSRPTSFSKGEEPLKGSSRRHEQGGAASRAEGADPYDEAAPSEDGSVKTAPGDDAAGARSRAANGGHHGGGVSGAETTGKDSYGGYYEGSAVPGAPLTPRSRDASWVGSGGDYYDDDDAYGEGGNDAYSQPKRTEPSEHPGGRGAAGGSNVGLTSLGGGAGGSGVGCSASAGATAAARPLTPAKSGGRNKSPARESSKEGGGAPASSSKEDTGGAAAATEERGGGAGGREPDAVKLLKLTKNALALHHWVMRQARDDPPSLPRSPSPLIVCKACAEYRRGRY